MVRVVVPPAATDTSEKLQVVSEGRFEQPPPVAGSKLTVPVNPPSAAVEMLNVALLPAFTVAVVSHAGGTDVELQTVGGRKSCTERPTLWLWVSPENVASLVVREAE